MSRIIGIGSDLVSMVRIRAIWQRYHEAFAHRILGPKEQSDLRSLPDPVAFLAKRFAAKEAMVKALGTGFRDGILFKEIEVQHSDMGRPIVVCTGAAARELEKQQILASHLSLSDEREFALAFVVLVGI